MGSLVSSLYVLNDLDGVERAFFVFPDLSVRIEGTFRLKFSLVDVGKPVSKILAVCHSEEFNVYPAKKFPGMTESSELSLSFARQGLKIPVRKETRVKRARSDS